MIRIATVVGARPQFVKAAVVSRAFRKHNDIEEIIIHSGQHYDSSMSDIFFSELDIPRPRYQLFVNREEVSRTTREKNIGQAFLLGSMMQRIEGVLLEENPDWVLVYGDTDTTLAAALTAFKLHIPVVHIEAGLRSFNMAMPEEGNRILTDRMSRLLFCPTDTAVENLRKEGFGQFESEVFRCGDVMQDAAIYYANKSKETLEVTNYNNFILCTLHRNENTSNPSILKEIFLALEKIATQQRMILPLHPGTRKKLAESGFNLDNSPIEIIQPVGYLEMVHLLKNCHMVMTDSGGLQKEAYFFRKPCITLRNETEWTELVESGCNFLSGTCQKDILSTFQKVLALTVKFPEALYGDGKTGEFIADIIKSKSNK